MTEPTDEEAAPAAQDEPRRGRPLRAPDSAAAVADLRAGRLVAASDLLPAPREARFPTASLEGVAPGQVEVGEPEANKVVAVVRDIQGELVPLTQHGAEVVTRMQRQGFTAIAFGNRASRREAAKVKERQERATQAAEQLRARGRG